MSGKAENAASPKCAGCGKALASAAEVWDSYDTGKSWCQECDGTKAPNDPSAGKGGEGDRGLGSRGNSKGLKRGAAAYGSRKNARDMWSLTEDERKKAKCDMCPHFGADHGGNGYGSVAAIASTCRRKGCKCPKFLPTDFDLRDQEPN